MYNVKIKRYLDTEQIQVFSDFMLSKGSEREDKRKIVYSTGEICPSNRSVVENPFFEYAFKPNFFEDDSETWIYDSCSIGCNMGNEKENIKRSCRRTKNAIYDISRCNRWEWFFTLTFNPEVVDSFDYSSTSKKLSNWFIQMRRKCPDMKYIVVPEQHISGRWHFHGLFSNVENMSFDDSGLKDKKRRIIYNVGSYKLGYSTATKIGDLHKASSYIAKYTTEELCAVTKGKKRYWHSKNCDKPIVEEYLVSMGNEELKRVYELAQYRKKVCSEFVDVEYFELPIYTTNTMRFNTSEEEFFPPHIDGIKEK